MYDSSWEEWGNLSDEEGILASDSPWLTNNTARSEAINESVTSDTTPPTACSYATSASASNENDKQICDPGLQQVDCLFRDN